jgi:hypothetical protein
MNSGTKSPFRLREGLGVGQSVALLLPTRCPPRKREGRH